MVRVIGATNQGSGALIDEDGLVVTTLGIVGEDSTVLVELAYGVKRMGIVLGVDEVSGLALVRISGQAYPALPLGDSSSLEAGDALLSLGYPLIGGVTESEGLVQRFNSLQGLRVQS